MKSWNDDTFTRLAKQKGYPARSVFKLKEIQKKYSIIKKGDFILDIGAAPGSWSLYASQVLKDNGKITGVDIQPLEKKILFSSTYQFIPGNIFTGTVLVSIEKAGPYDVILSDAAPSTTGDRLVDATRSYDLCVQVLEIVRMSLKRGGKLVIKIFQGEDSGELLKLVKNSFLSTKVYKPSASRKKSAEIYYIGFNYEGV